MKVLFKKLVAEAIGTFVLVFCACGVAMWTHGEPVATSLTFGLVIVAMAYTVGRISGCHINPAVSLGCLLTKRMTFKDFIAYVCAQIVGGLLGGLLIFGLFKMSGVATVGDACNNVVGYTTLADASAGNYIAAIVAEIVLTCIFVYVILNVTDPKHDGVGKKAGLLIGLTLTLVHLIGIGLTGTSVNPARSIATALCALIYNGNTDPIAQIWIFIVGPLAGGALAALLFNLLHKEKEVE